ncbi:MAG TPA: PEP-CTERM sorting domain-containing protein, partial [Tepidisphaeraceae bacterium]|nr:PEP-CTERM sorting domain-containing protein [Tepidisphaeraceae bacterium]
AGAFRSVRVYAADLNAAKASLYGAIRNANAAGAADPLDGIIDSGLHAGAGIGIAAIGDHILIRPTKKGDLNLDGQVTISDFIDLASNFNASGKTWQEGDLNYDGSVTISDFIDLASNFNSSYAGTVGAISASDQLTLASFASSIGADPSIIGSAVPEPAALSLLAVGALGLMRRRRRA